MLCYVIIIVLVVIDFFGLFLVQNCHGWQWRVNADGDGVGEFKTL